MSSRTLLKGAALGIPEPGRVLRDVNDLLCDDNDAAHVRYRDLCHLLTRVRPSRVRQRRP